MSFFFADVESSTSRAWMLYGHSHGNLPDIGGKTMDVGVDCHGYKPISLDEVAEFMAGREFVPVDHHIEG